MQRGGGGRGRILPAGYHILKKFKQMRLGSVLDTNSLNLDPGPEFLLNLDPNLEYVANVLKKDKKFSSIQPFCLQFILFFSCGSNFEPDPQYWTAETLK